MTARQLNLPLLGTRPAVLTLPQPLTPETLCELEQALNSVLGTLRREVDRDANKPAQLEYASWMQQLRAAHH